MACVAAAIITVLVLQSANASVLRGATRVPTARDVTQPPGTKFGNGFTVAKSTKLIGATFPTEMTYPWGQNPVMDYGWRAVLLVEGDPRDVMVEYREQAAAMGIALKSWRAVMCDFEMNSDLYACAAYGSSEDSKRSITIDFLRGDASYGPVSHAVLRYSDLSVPEGGTDPAMGVIDAERGPAPPPVPSRWPRRAARGQPMVPRLTFEARPLIVESGSVVVAPTAPLSASTGAYDWIVLLRVPGSAREVAQAYLKQLGKLHTLDQYRSPEVGATKVGSDTTVYRFYGETLGSDGHFVEIVDGRGGSWMMVRGSAQT